MIKKPNVHSFLIEDAEAYGVDAAVILYNIRYWLSHEYANLGKDKCKVFDGYVWTFNSAKAFAEQLTYFSSNKIQKILKKLENDGVIICGNFNKRGYDRTKWYTMPEYKVDSSIQPNDETQSANLNISFSQMAEPIPDYKQQIENNTPIVPKGDKEREELFWLIAALWNKGFKNFTQIRDYNNTRKKNLKRIVKNYPNFKDIEKWKDLFKRMKKSEWIMSRDGRNNGFKMNIDWVMKDEYFTKIVEGNYN